MKIKRKDLNILIESLLTGQYESKSTLIEGVDDWAAKNALLLYVENTDEATLKSKIRKLLGPSSKDGIYAKYYKNSKVLIDEAFKRVEWWYSKFTELIDKSMLTRAITLFFDDREKFYDEVLAWINKHYDKLYKGYIKSFSDEELRNLVLSIYSLHNLDRNDYDDEEEYNDDLEFKEMIENYDRNELEEDFMDDVINKPVVFSDDGTPENAKGRLELSPKSDILKGFEGFKKKASDDGILSIIIKGIYSFIAG